MAANRATYGIGQYGSASYGENPVTAKAPLSVSKTGAIYGSATYGTNTYGGSITETHSGIAATGSVTTVTVTADSSVTLPSVSATGSVTTVNVSADSNLSITAPAPARGNPDLAGALHAEYFVPTDTGNPNVRVMAFEDSTTVFADGSSLGTISSAGGKLTLSASDYENKLISADKPITLQSGDNETTGVPTSWQGTSFGFRNTRTGVVLQFRSISGTATVQIFKDGSLETTLSVPDNTTTSQTYADDTSDPEYQIFSDLPIVAFKSGNASLQTDTHPLFPASRDIYGFASSSGVVVKVEDYGSSASYVEFRSNGGGGSSSTISTFKTTGGNTSDFKGPSVRVVTGADVAGFSFADGDGGEKSSWIPQGCFAHEFRLIEDAEFLAIMGAPGTDGRNINVFDSSGNLIDTVQLSGDTSGSDFPTHVQIVSNSTTDSNLTPVAKSYDLTAGVRIVSEVPVGVIVEDDSGDNEENLFGLRFFGGLASGEAGVVLPNVSATSTANDSLTFTADSNVTTPSVSATATPDADLVIEADARHTVTSVQGVSGVTSVGTVGVAIHEVTGVEGTGQVTTSTISGDNNTAPSGVSGTGQNTTVTVSGDSNVAVSIGKITGAVTTVTVSADSVTTVPSVSATGSVTTVGISIPKTVVVPSVTATGSTTTVTVFTGSQQFVDVPSVEATATVDPDVVIEGDALHVITSVQGVTATGGVGAVVAGADIDTLTGVEATGQVATATTSGSANTTPASAQGTGQTSTVTISGVANFALGSVEATTSVNTVDIVAPRVVALNSVSTTASVNTATVSAGSDLTSPSVSTTATVDPDVVIEADALHVITSVQGVGATGGIGSVVAQANLDTITGVQASGSIGTVDVAAPRNVAVSGVQATGGTTTVTLVAKATVTLPSNSADGNVTVPTVSGTGTLTLPGVSGTSSVTTVGVTAANVTLVASFNLTGVVNGPTITTEINIFDANNRNENRVVYVAQDKPRTVFVSADKLRLVNISADTPRTVFVPPDSPRVVDVPADKPRTIYVRAA